MDKQEKPLPSLNYEDVRWLRSIVAPTEMLAISAIFPILYGVIYCRYYFHRLSFPYQLIELDTTFYLFKSLQPIAIALSYLIFTAGILIPNSAFLAAALPVFRVLPRSWQDLICKDFLFGFLFSQARAAVVIACAFLGRFVLDGLGYDYLPLTHGVHFYAWLLAAALRGFSTGMAAEKMVYALRGICPAKPSRGSGIERRLNQAAIALVIIAAAVSALRLGSVEAEHLIQGDSRNSMLITFSLDSLPNGTVGPFILVMMYQDYYYVAEQQEEPVEHLSLFAVSKSEIVSYDVVRLNQ